MADLKADFLGGVVESFGESPVATPDLPVQEMALGPRPPSGPTTTYRMRAIDDTLTTVVYWDSAIIDAAGVDYGGPGPLSDVVVSEVIG